MGLLRTLSFTLCITALLGFVLSSGILAFPDWQYLLVFAVLGLLFFYVFGPDESLQEISILFITSAVVLIVSGFLGNAAMDILPVVTGRIQAAGGQVPPLQVATLFGRTNVLLRLVLLFIGMFAPALAILRFKEKQKIDWGILIRSAICTGLVYLLALLVYTWALARVIGAHVVSFG